MTTLLRSQICCLDCHDVIASLWRHDFNSCKCGAVSIDGGRDYLRVLGLGWVDASITVEGDLNNQDARIVLQALKDIESQKPAGPSWALAVLEHNGLIEHDDEGLWAYIGPPLAERKDENSNPTP
jgi:hypothetical protein